MLRFFRRLVPALAALGGVALGWAENAPAAPASVAAQTLPPELQAELDALQRGAWSVSGTARGSLGWRDNVLLSPFAPIERPFARTEVEALLLRPMRQRWEFISFLNGDVLRYFSPPRETGGEQQWSLHSEGRWQVADPVRLSMKGAGYQRDVVMDLSETEQQREIAPTRVRGGYVTATARVALPADFYFEPHGQAKRTNYRDYSSDHDETKTGGKLEWRRRAFGVSAGWAKTRRRYIDRPELTAGGHERLGTRLRFHRQEGELRSWLKWSAAGEWSLAATVSGLENRDRASGYFDYDQKRGRIELGWERSVWRVNVDAEAKRIDYLNQEAVAGTGSISPPKRISDDYETSLRLEREIDERWALFGEHRWERSRSNETSFSYRANTVLAGVQRTF